MEPDRASSAGSQGRRPAIARLRQILRVRRGRAGAGFQYFQAGGSTRVAIKRSKRP